MGQNDPVWIRAGQIPRPLYHCHFSPPCHRECFCCCHFSSLYFSSAVPISCCCAPVWDTAPGATVHRISTLKLWEQQGPAVPGLSTLLVSGLGNVCGHQRSGHIRVQLILLQRLYLFIARVFQTKSPIFMEIKVDMIFISQFCKAVIQNLCYTRSFTQLSLNAQSKHYQFIMISKTQWSVHTAYVQDLTVATGLLH